MEDSSCGDLATGPIGIQMLNAILQQPGSMDALKTIFAQASQDTEVSVGNNNIGDNESMIENVEGDVSEEGNEDERSIDLELRKFKCLWDINAPSYKERLTKNNAWQMLSQLFNRDGKK